MSDSRTFGLTFKEVLLIDSTTIRLFSDILKGVGRNPKGDEKGKKQTKVTEKLRLRKVCYPNPSLVHLDSPVTDDSHTEDKTPILKFSRITVIFYL